MNAGSHFVCMSCTYFHALVLLQSVVRNVYKVLAEEDRLWMGSWVRFFSLNVSMWSLHAYTISIPCYYSSKFSSEHNKAVAKKLVREAKSYLSNVAPSTILRKWSARFLLVAIIVCGLCGGWRYGGSKPSENVQVYTSWSAFWYRSWCMTIVSTSFTYRVYDSLQNHIKSLTCRCH